MKTPKPLFDVYLNSGKCTAKEELAACQIKYGKLTDDEIRAINKEAEK